MSLRIRLAITLALLAAATAIIVAAAGYRVTAGRLDEEINQSLTQLTDRLHDPDGRTARLVCNRGPLRRTADGVTSPQPNARIPDGGGGPGRGRVPSGVAVQCLDTTGTAFFTGGTALPISGEDREIAAGKGNNEGSRSVDVDNTKTRIRTVAVSGLGAVQVARPLDERDRVLGSLLRRYALLALGATGAAAVVGLLLARRTTRPIATLTTAAEQIASTGDLNIAVDTTRHGRDETGRLAHAFATMVDALRSSREQQSRLIQDAGHELRTPLTSLRTNVSLLRRPDLPPDKREAALDALHLELRELTDLTNELVALSVNQTEPEAPALVHLHDVVQHSVARCQRRTGRRIDASLAPVDLVGQPAALSRMIDNLLANATKFAPGSEPIEVALVATSATTTTPATTTPATTTPATATPAATATLSVRDHGPGIAVDDLPHLFERFYRATGARSLPGSGLGLSIVNDTAVAHGGSVAATNAPGGGACFAVTLPIRTNA